MNLKLGADLKDGDYIAVKEHGEWETYVIEVHGGRKYIVRPGTRNAWHVDPNASYTMRSNLGGQYA